MRSVKTARKSNTNASADGSIGYFPGSSGTVTIDGTGSRWTNAGSLLVGGSDQYYYSLGGVGKLSITHGGAVTTGVAYVGYANAATAAGETFDLGFSGFMFRAMLQVRL